MTLSAKDIKKLQKLSTSELMVKALQTKLRHRSKKFSLCSIINAKSGKCSEDCKFCVQSGHYQTDAPVYPLKNEKEIIAAAREAHNIGATHFSLVTSGRGLNQKDIRKVAKIITSIKKQTPVKLCASLGILTKQDFEQLKEAGLSRYHHNLETSKEFFPKVVTTHSFQERIDTIRAAQEAGLEVCAGGIFGLGEREEDRISMALSLRECNVDSVPINILIPLPGTPFADIPPIAIDEIIKAIALYRLIFPDIPIRLAAGRESALGDFLSSIFMAGADGMMIGGYLTQRGRSPEKDNRFVDEIKKLWSI